jgi:hypothetical protein
MTDHEHPTPVALAIFTMAAVKAATDSFERGDVGLCDAIAKIIEAIDDYRAVAFDRGRREAA